MARILITSGPTRQYLDPVRYLTNASSGRMGAALAAAVLEAGHRAVVVSGPVDVEYPPGAQLIPVVSTEDMLVALGSASWFDELADAVETDLDTALASLDSEETEAFKALLRNYAKEG
jgi:phosphopantothenoylcysteine synthetase/decarboxylase